MTPEPCMPCNGKTYLDDMIGMKDQFNNDIADEKSDVANFYAGLNVLVTGGSGFLGKLIMEKLLRTCPNVGKVYMLLRAKKGKTPAQRFKEVFEDPLYDRLRREQPNFADHVVLIEGDTGEKDLGLSSADRDLLVKNTHIVFHGAASVNFEETLRKAVNVNVRGVKMLLLLAKEMKNLKVFLYISTAYSNCTSDCIEEKFYKPAMDPDEAIDLVAKSDDETLQRIAPKVIGAWPNTYTFSKALAEDTVRRYSRELPSCIVRPSIVVSTVKEPLAGWSDNMYGATGASVSIYCALVRVFLGDTNKIAELIPADYVINNIIVAAWDTSKLWNQRKMTAGQSDASDATTQSMIYNCVTSCQKPVTWRAFLSNNFLHGIEVPSRFTLWHRVLTCTKREWLYNFYIFFLHLIPAVILDTLARLTGKKPRLLKIYQKVHKFNRATGYFGVREWKFNNDNVLRLWERTSLTDRKKFDFNVGHLDWNDFYLYHMRGIRVYILKDPMTTLEKARAKYNKLTRIHFAIVAILCGLLIWNKFILTSFVALIIVYKLEPSY